MSVLKELILLHSSIKEFIESNINLIENSAWEDLWTIWYQKYSEWDYHFTELLEILLKSGCVTEEEALMTRQASLHKQIEIVFEEELKDKQRISLYAVPFLFYSNLHLEYTSVERMFDDVSKNYGFKRLAEGWFR